MPGLIVHGFFVGRVERIVEQVDGVAVRLVRALSRGGESTAPAAAQGAARHPSSATTAAPASGYITNPARPAAQAPSRPAAR